MVQTSQLSHPRQFNFLALKELLKKMMNTLVFSTSSKTVLLDRQLCDGHDMATARATLDPGIIPDGTPLTIDLCESGIFIAVATRDVDNPA